MLPVPLTLLPDSKEADSHIYFEWEVFWLFTGKIDWLLCKQTFITLATGQMAFASIGTPKSTVNQSGVKSNARPTFWRAEMKAMLGNYSLIYSLLQAKFS